jgi:uncharacterized protein (DUF2236 family)
VNWVLASTFAASDPDLLRWVRCTETDSYLTAYEEFVAPLDLQAAGRYVGELVPVGRRLGLRHDVPVNVRQLREYLADMDPALLVTPTALEVRDLVLRSPLPAVFRPVAGTRVRRRWRRCHPPSGQLYGLRWDPQRDRRARDKGRWICRTENYFRLLRTSGRPAGEPGAASGRNQPDRCRARKSRVRGQAAAAASAS